MIAYLSRTGEQPITKDEMLSNIVTQIAEKKGLYDMMQVRRYGKDKDPIFWSFGKIHGLENIAFADKE